MAYAFEAESHVIASAIETKNVSLHPPSKQPSRQNVCHGICTRIRKSCHCIHLRQSLQLSSLRRQQFWLNTHVILMELSAVCEISVASESVAFPAGCGYAEASGKLWWRLQHWHRALFNEDIIRTEWKDWKQNCKRCVDASFLVHSLAGEHIRIPHHLCTGVTPAVVSTFGMLIIMIENLDRSRSPALSKRLFNHLQECSRKVLLLPGVLESMNVIEHG